MRKEKRHGNRPVLLLLLLLLLLMPTMTTMTTGPAVRLL
jgi:hypothetical protein